MQAGMVPGLFLLWFVLEAAYLIAEGDAGGHAAGAVFALVRPRGGLPYRGRRCRRACCRGCFCFGSS